MPSTSLNVNWDIEDPNAEIPFLPENGVRDEELKNTTRGTTNRGGADHISGDAIHIENSSKG